MNRLYLPARIWSWIKKENIFLSCHLNFLKRKFSLYLFFLCLRWKKKRRRRKINEQKLNLIRFDDDFWWFLKFIFIRFLQIQIFGYNSQLYSNFSDAIFRAQGIVAVSVLLQVIICILIIIKFNNKVFLLIARRPLKSGASYANGSIR